MKTILSLLAIILLSSCGSIVGYDNDSVTGSTNNPALSPAGLKNTPSAPESSESSSPGAPKSTDKISNLICFRLLFWIGKKDETILLK